MQLRQRLLSAVVIFIPLFSQAGKQCLTEKRLPSMGTFFELQIVTDCKQKPSDQIFLESQSILDKMESDMSLYQTQSPINQLNKTGKIKIPSEHFRRIVEQSLAAGKKTDGAFDISVWPILQKIQKSFEKTKKPPTDEELDQLKPLVNYQQIELSDTEIKFKKAGMMITLDGVAKGYAVDVVFDFLKTKKVKNMLLNFSGNMRWVGHRQDNKKWHVERWNPFSEKAEKIPNLESGAIASSGIEINNYSEDKKWHHIIDPQTLRPTKHWVGTTVIGPSATQCDILSTSTFVLSEQGLKKTMSTQYPEYKVWAIDPSGRTVQY